MAYLILRVGRRTTIATTNGSTQVIFDKSVSSGPKILDSVYFEFVCVGV